LHGAGLDDLNADDGADQRRLARAARAEQAGDGAGADAQVEAVENELAAASDLQPFDLYHVIRHGSDYTDSDCHSSRSATWQNLSLVSGTGRSSARATS
jgi:hypothetical protein